MNRVKGTKDYLPKDMIKIKRIMEIIEKNFRKFGFEPMDTPRLEPLELFESRIGEGEKDIFKFEDKSKRKIALRFDQTTSLIRIFQNYSIPLPLKRYTIGKSWRYEEPQRGRYREFWQADIDIIGVNSINADAEVIACMYNIFKELGLNVKVSINSRKLLEDLLEIWKVPKRKRIDFLRIIDKRDKIGDEKVKKLLKDSGFDIKVFENLSSIQLENIRSESADEIRELMNKLDEYSIDYEFNQFIVRGLDYYDGLVYEIVSDVGTLAGGGRYNKMIKINSNYIPAVGMSIGINRLYDLIKNKINDNNFIDFYVCWVSNFEKALKIANKLRKKYNVDINLQRKSLSKQIEYASKKKIRKIIIVGKEEKLTIRNLETGEQIEISVDEV